jgi:pyrimidine-nucleoside phosphorylase
MLLLAGKANSLDEAKEMVTAVRQNGAALEKFRQMVAAQGGDVAQIDDPDLLPQAKFVEPIIAPRSGSLAAVATGEIGWAAVQLGGGRMVKTDHIDHAVGFVLRAKIGDTFAEGDELGTIHANDEEKLAQAREELLAALTWSNDSVPPQPHFHGTIR